MADEKKIPWYIQKWLLERREINDNGCWNYTGGTRDGYGVVAGRQAHRVAWLLWVGKIPKGHHIHHVCENPVCFNPEHLESKLPGDHTRFHKASKRLCVRGHDLDDPENVYPNRRAGVRQCKLCARARYHERQK